MWNQATVAEAQAKLAKLEEQLDASRKSQEQAIKDAISQTAEMTAKKMKSAPLVRY